jgi:CRP/FNR family transcriptional regulator
MTKQEGDRKMIFWEESCEGEGPWIFSSLNEEGQRELASLLRPIEYDKDEVIFQEGELAFGLYIVCRGRVKLAKRSSKGKRQILKLVGPGELLGEKTMFDQETYTAYAKTLEPTKLYFIERGAFLDFLRRHPQVAINLIEKLARELKSFQNRLLEISYEGSTERLARLLLKIGEVCGVPEGDRLYLGIDLSRAELAEMAGISTETAIRTLSRLRERGLVELVGHKIYIRDRAGLERLAEPTLSSVSEGS